MQRRGDPFGEIRPAAPFRINTAEWIFLKRALFLASVLWSEPDKNGTSYPVDLPSRARAISDDHFAMSMVKSLTVAPHPSVAH